MNDATFQDDVGPILLGERIGRGGEGEVYALGDGSARAVKIYLQPDGRREAKVEAMVRAELALRCPDVTFPTGLVRRTDGSFAGFVMPLASESHALHELYSPASRRRYFPHADWRFLIRVGGNLARVFDAVHRAGAVVGDVNGSGVLVSRLAVVTMIDADSFQMGPDHRCRVGVLEYTPPELQGCNLDAAIRTIDHDGFGLAVLLFQLIFLGRHPHAGVPRGRDVSLGEAIATGCFAYSRLRRVRSSPPPNMLLLSDVPLGVRLLFERAFALGAGLRPSAAEWIEELDEFEAGLTSCGRSGAHVRSIWSRECPWCRIEISRAVGSDEETAERQTIRHYPPHLKDAVETMIERVRSEAGEETQPRPIARSVEPSSDAQGSGRNDSAVRMGIALADVHAAKGRHSHDRFTLRYLDAHDEFVRTLGAWRIDVGIRLVNRLAAELGREFENLGLLPEKRREEELETELRARAATLRRRLAAEPLAGAAVPQLGPRRRSALTAAGIVTAADVTQVRLDQVRGLGSRAALALLLWRDAIAVRILRGLPETMLSREDITGLEAKHRLAEEQAERQLRRTLVAVGEATDRVAARAKRPDARVEAARAALTQAVADLEFLGLPRPVPSKASPSSLPVSSTTGTRKRNGCPLCGGPMLRRKVRTGNSANRPFLGCARYPLCSGSRRIPRAKP